MSPLCSHHHHHHPQPTRGLSCPFSQRKAVKTETVLSLLRLVSMGRKRERRRGIIVSRQTEIPRLSRLVYYGRKSLRPPVARNSINHLARKRALIIARYQICIRPPVSSRYPSPLRCHFHINNPFLEASLFL